MIGISKHLYAVSKVGKELAALVVAFGLSRADMVAYLHVNVAQSDLDNVIH